MKEIWKHVIGYISLYEVSNKGRIRSLDRIVNCRYNKKRTVKGRLLKLTQTNKMYRQVDLSKNGKRSSKRVHSLVAEAFIGSCPDGQEIRHGKLGKFNDEVDNLSYGTHSENLLDKRRDGTAGKIVQRSDGKLFASTYHAAESVYGQASCISKVCRGIRTKYKSFGWKYI